MFQATLLATEDILAKLLQIAKDNTDMVITLTGKKLYIMAIPPVRFRKSLFSDVKDLASLFMKKTVEFSTSRSGVFYVFGDSSAGIVNKRRVLEKHMIRTLVNDNKEPDAQIFRDLKSEKKEAKKELKDQKAEEKTIRAIKKKRRKRKEMKELKEEELQKQELQKKQKKTKVKKRDLQEAGLEIIEGAHGKEIRRAKPKMVNKAKSKEKKETAPKATKKRKTKGAEKQMKLAEEVKQPKARKRKSSKKLNETKSGSKSRKKVKVI